MNTKNHLPSGIEEFTDFGKRRVRKEQKFGLVQDHFNTVAGKYDFTNTILSMGRQHLWKKRAVAMMELRPGDRVLDVCGGTGDLAIRAAREVGDRGCVVLYDFNRAMIDVGHRKISRSVCKDRITFIQGDAEKIALADDSFDAAMVGFGIRNLTEMETGFREMHRVLKPGGRFMCLEFGQPPAAWFKRLYDFYSFHIMPAAGRILVGSREAYTYLPESIRLFPGPEKLSSILQQTGFERVRFQLLTGGIAMIHVGQKKP